MLVLFIEVGNKAKETGSLGGIGQRTGASDRNEEFAFIPVGFEGSLGHPSGDVQERASELGI